jgi:hypothetical protein
LLAIYRNRKKIEKFPVTFSVSRELVEAALSRYGGPFATGHEQLSVTLDYGQTLHRRWLGVLAPALTLVIDVEPSQDIEAHLERAFPDDSAAVQMYNLLYRIDLRMVGQSDALRRIRRCRDASLAKGLTPGPKTIAVLRDLQMVEGRRTFKVFCVRICPVETGEGVPCCNSHPEACVEILQVLLVFAAQDRAATYARAF